MDGLGQKTGGPSPSVLLDRFRETIKEREEEFGVVDGDEIVAFYEDFLAELTLNSKPIITELTIIAGEQREHARGIAEAICSRIIEVPVEKKLPSLYLLDSIVKNIGCEYVRYFATQVPEVFCEAYNHVNPSMRPSMRHLFGTWSQVFPSPVLEKIENELQFSSHGSKQSFSAASARQSESPSPHPGHGIHINPKYLESQQQFEQSTRDSRHQRGISSRLDLYEDSEFDHPGMMSSLNGAPRIGTLQSTTGRASAIVGNEKLPHSRNEALRASASSAALRMRDRNGRWEKDFPPFDDFQQLETRRTHNPSEEYRKRRPRELIDAYGNNRGGNIQSERPSKIKRHNSIGINAEEATRTWQNTEEEEYVWEDMSPTSVSQNKSDKRIPYTADSGSFGMGITMRRPHASILDSDFRTPSIRTPLLSDEATPMFDDRNPILASTSRSMRPQSRRDLSHYENSPYTQEPRNSQYPPSQSSQQSLSPRLHGRMPLSASGVPILGVFSSSAMDNHVVLKPSSPPTVWPPVHKSQSLPPFLPHQQDFRNPLNSSSAHQGPIQSFSMPWRPSDVTDRTSFNSSIPIQMPHQSSGTIHFNRQNQEQNSALRFQHHDLHGRIIPSVSPQVPSHFVGQSLHHATSLEGPSIENRLMHRVPDSSFHAHGVGGSLPPLPPGPPPPSGSHIAPHNSDSLISSSPGEKFSGLISSLVSQGLISLQSTTLPKDSVGLEFDPEFLKVRHESVINNLYVNLPRQCTTCGMRFKCQEEHSSHMDWHVTKNRMSKMRKQKPSRKWFVSCKEWLSGAEAVGTDVIPGFLPTETVVDKTEEKELAVPADENQNLCALCGDPFEDFYSDEADEWMYRGAVYMNAPGGSNEGLDKSQHGPIVHAKCMSESSQGQKQS